MQLGHTYRPTQHGVTIADVRTVMLTLHAAVISDSSRATASQLTKILSVEPPLKKAAEHEHLEAGRKRTKSNAENVRVTGE